MPSDDVSGLLESLRREWSGLPCGPALEAAAGTGRASDLSPARQALHRLRAAALALARDHGEHPACMELLRQALEAYAGRPMRTWEEVVWALNVAAAAPAESGDLLRTVMVSVRLGVKGEAPALAALGMRGDATHELLPVITGRLAELFPSRQTVGWMLYRQLVKSLPHLGAQGGELHQVRSAAEYLHWLVECPLTLHLREEIHSKASPANLAMVRAYRQYLESGDASGLERLWLAQKIPEHDRQLGQGPAAEAKKAKLLQAARELEGLLTRIYHFDPTDVHSVLADVKLWLDAAGVSGGSEIHADVTATLDASAAGRDDEAADLLTRSRQRLEIEIGARPRVPALKLLYLDLELEKLGYLLFGRMVHEDLAEITGELLPRVVAALQWMAINASMKGQGTPKLRWLAEMLERLPPDPQQATAHLLVLNHHFNDEISAVSLGLYREYSQIARRVLTQCGAGEVEVAVNKFVDGLIRDTTLQHLGELSVRVHHFALEQLEAAAPEAAQEIRLQVDAFDRRVGAESSEVLARSGPADPAAPMWVFRFRPGQILHDEQRVDVLGGKGAHLCEMCRLDLAVPPGFIVSVPACRRYMTLHALEPAVRDEILASVGWLEGVSGRQVGSPDRPLLVAVRSGAPQSMPGMLDTVLNVGMSDEIARALIEAGGDESFVLDLYARFLAGYARTVLSLTDVPRPADARADWDAVRRVQDHALRAGAEPFWQRPGDQIVSAVEAVFRSWNNPHAVLFRKTQRVPHADCTAATVQQMVFGNADENSCTGVLFTCNPHTGAEEIYGEYLPRAQGEDLVAGLQTPLPLLPCGDHPGRSLAERMPNVLAELRKVAATLEGHFGRTQEVEFTVDRGTLYVLQTRQAHRAGAGSGAPSGDGAGADDGSIPPASQPFRVIARGLGASAGGVIGRIALSEPAVRRLAGDGGKVIFVRETTTPEDLPGMLAADGVLTRTGGATSHAANNARYLGTPCVVGCRGMELDAERGEIRFGEIVLHEGDELLLDGLSGEVGVRAEPGRGGA